MWQQHVYRNVSERQARVISVTRWLLTVCTSLPSLAPPPSALFTFRIPKSQLTFTHPDECVWLCSDYPSNTPAHDVSTCAKALVAVATGFVAIIVIYGADYLTYLKFYLTGLALYGWV